MEVEVEAVDTRAEVEEVSTPTIITMGLITIRSSDLAGPLVKIQVHHNQVKSSKTKGSYSKGTSLTKNLRSGSTISRTKTSTLT